MQSAGQRLKPEEWACGDEVVLMDVVAPFGGEAAVVQKLKELLGQGKGE